MPMCWSRSKTSDRGSDRLQDASRPTRPVGEAAKPDSRGGGRGRRAASIRWQPASPGAGAAGAESQNPKSRAPEPPESPDLGLALNDYLLGRLVLPEGDALYRCTRVSLRRRADDRTVDVYEMYWADLSRLGAGGLRALSSLYQVLFHLSTLAADLVDQVSLSTNGGTAWRVLQRLQAWIAWLMKGPSAVLQLAMLLMVAFGAAALVAPELQGPLLAAAFGLGSVVLTALAALAWLRGTPGPVRWAQLLFLLPAAARAWRRRFARCWVPMMYFGASALAATLLGLYLIEPIPVSRRACACRPLVVWRPSR
jgi:hypothetical protein